MFRAMCVMMGLASVPAWASNQYPGWISTKLGTMGVPAQNCQLCHQTATGGGVPTRKFGISMTNEGLMGGGNQMLLNAALDALQMKMTDSDGDGVPDLTEIRNRTNPNVADAMPMTDAGSATDGGVTGAGGISGGTGGAPGAGGAAVGAGGGMMMPPGEPPPLRFGCGAQVAPGLVALAVGLFAHRRRRSAVDLKH